MIFTVHVPRDVYDPIAAADRARLIPDGFSFAAFFLTPLWFLRHRSVTGLLIWLIAALAIVAAQRLFALEASAVTLLVLLASLFFGIEGTAILRWTTDLWRFRCVDVISAGNREEAERTFMRRWTSRGSRIDPRAATPNAGGAYSPLGLFPDEGG